MEIKDDEGKKEIKQITIEIKKTKEIIKEKEKIQNKEEKNERGIKAKKKRKRYKNESIDKRPIQNGRSSIKTN